MKPMTLCMLHMRSTTEPYPLAPAPPFCFFKLFFDNLIFKERLTADTFYFFVQEGKLWNFCSFPTRRVEVCLLLKG